MSKRSSKSKNVGRKKAGGTRKKRLAGMGGAVNSVRDGIRQFGYPPEFRIPRPAGAEFAEAQAEHAVPVPQPDPCSPDAGQPSVSPSALADVATCFWYLRTKHFRREWANEDTADDDPRTRRTLGRLNKGVDALKRAGIELEDPTGKRYADGSGGTMKPLDFVQTEGQAHRAVSETVKPLVYWEGRIVQQAEVFVAVPMAGAREPERDAVATPPPAVNGKTTPGTDAARAAADATATPASETCDTPAQADTGE